MKTISLTLLLRLGLGFLGLLIMPLNVNAGKKEIQEELQIIRDAKPGHVRQLAATLVQRLAGALPADNEEAIAIHILEPVAINQLPAELPPPVNEANRLAIIRYVPPLPPEFIALMIALLPHIQYLANQHSSH